MASALNRWRDRLTSWMRRNAAVLLVSLLISFSLFVYLIPNIFISIQPGQGGVLWKRLKGGTITDRYYGEGIHVIFPWDRMYRYDLRYQQQSKEFEVLSSDGLLYSAELTVRFRVRPEVLGLLHKCVGPHYLNTLIFPEVGSVARSVIAQLTPDELYTSKRRASETGIKSRLEFGITSCYPRETSQSGQDMKTNETRHSDHYIEINDVFIRRVLLPPKVAEAIENKLIQRQQMLEYDYRIQKEKKEAERKRIEANGIKVFQDVVKEGPSPALLQWRGIDATLELAKSNNSKIIFIGVGKKGGLPLILGPPED
jgi:prohibitin 2